MNDDTGGPRGRGRRGAGPGSCGGPGPRGGGPGGGRYRRSVLEAAILASLAESTSHGYNLVDQIEALTSDLVCNDAGSMYRLLRAMEEDGLVSSAWQTPDAGPSRRVYVITEQGIEALELMARSLSQRAASMQRLADHAAQAVATFRASGT
jgi:PadR family transcriptional regulator, regulatory protein PadR